MYNRTEKLIYSVLGVAFVAAIAFGFRNRFVEVQDVPLTCVESRLQYDALRMCMQTADTTGCKMQVEDFARHAELELQLTECE